jgi:hypothetical protein
MLRKIGDLRADLLKKLRSGPKSKVDFAQLAARVNSLSFKAPIFSATFKGVCNTPWGPVAEK